MSQSETCRRSKELMIVQERFHDFCQKDSATSHGNDKRTVQTRIDAAAADHLFW